MPLQLDNESELREAQAALFNANSQSGWVLLNYVTPNTVHFSAGGEGGIDDVKPLLKIDQIQYVLIRLGGIQQDGKATFRDVFLNVIGQGVGILEKGKKSVLFQDAEAILQPFHSSVTVHDKNKLNSEILIEKSTSGGKQVIE